MVRPPAPPLDLITAWDAALADADVPASTRRVYLGALRDFAAWFASTHRMPLTPATLTPIDLTGYRTHIQARLAPATVNVRVAALRAFSTWLVESGQVADNPGRRVKAVAQSPALAPKALAPKEVNALLREAALTRHAARDTAIVQLLVQTGLRISECADLRLGDVTIRERSGQVLVRAGKGNKARSVPLNASARQALATMLAARWGLADDSIPAVLAAWPGDATLPLWVGQKGDGPLSVRAIRELIAGLVATCAARGLVPADTSPHTLRHTFARFYLADHPGDLVGLSRLLGHSTLDVTKIYVQPTADDLAERVEGVRLNAYG